MKKLLWKTACIAVAAWAMAACTPDQPDPGPDTPPEVVNPPIVEPDPDPEDDLTVEEAVEARFEGMTLRDKVGQLFITRPEALIPGFTTEDMQNVGQHAVTRVSADMTAFDKEYPVGGIILYAHNITYPGQLTTFTGEIHNLAHTPLICIDEEGGTVTRIARNASFGAPTFPNMAEIGATRNPERAYHVGHTIGGYLKYYGIDVDFAPVADVFSNPANTVIGSRSFGSDPALVASMVTRCLEGLAEAGVTGCLKHFPGHGDTHADTHYGYAESLKTWDQMRACEMVPFRAGIEAGAELIMTAHIAAPNVTGSSIPATMSSLLLQDKLREELGYEHLIITDGMEMGAITSQYSPGEAAVSTLLAGADIVLGPLNYREAFDAVMDAVQAGTLSEERIDESVRRVLRLKVLVKRAGR